MVDNVQIFFFFLRRLLRDLSWLKMSKENVLKLSKSIKAAVNEWFDLTGICCHLLNAKQTLLLDAVEHFLTAPTFFPLGFSWFHISTFPLHNTRPRSKNGLAQRARALTSVSI